LKKNISEAINIKLDKINIEKNHLLSWSGRGTFIQYIPVVNVNIQVIAEKIVKTVMIVLFLIAIKVL
jgi:hypothetical protein